MPYIPKHHLPIQLDGVENNDYTMIIGYPGRTNRFLTSYGVKEALETTYPEIIRIRTKKLEIMKAGMDVDEKTKLQYASKYSGISNYWKYYIGQSRGLKRMRVYDKKLKIENQFGEWVSSSESASKSYSNVLPMLSDAYERNKKIAFNRTYLTEAIFQGAEILSFSYTIKNRISSLPKGKEERAEKLKQLKKLLRIFTKIIMLKLIKTYFHLCLKCTIITFLNPNTLLFLKR